MFSSIQKSSAKSHVASLGFNVKSIVKRGSFGNGIGARNCLRHHDYDAEEAVAVFRTVVLQVRR